MRPSQALGSTLVVVLLLGGLAAGAAALRVPEKARPASGDQPGPTDLNDLSMEVGALQMLHLLQLTPAQLQDLAQRARSTAQTPEPRTEPKVSARMRQTFRDLRRALLAGDAEKIDQLNRDLDKLFEKEQPEFEDGVEISDAARDQAPDVLRRLSARQAALFLAGYADTFPDPRERLAEAITEVRKRPDKEWQPLRDEVADAVAELVAGLDVDAEAGVRDRVTALLDRAHRLKDDAFKEKRAELDREVDRIVGKLGPTDLHRHFLERSLAELLSNPRLAAAIEARLRKDNLGK
jgi:hypothetical protein